MQSALTLINDGNFDAQPEIEMTGPITANCTFFNESQWHMTHATDGTGAGRRDVGRSILRPGGCIARAIWRIASSILT